MGMLGHHQGRDIHAAAKGQAAVQRADTQDAGTGPLSTCFASYYSKGKAINDDEAMRQSPDPSPGS